MDGGALEMLVLVAIDCALTGVMRGVLGGNPVPQPALRCGGVLTPLHSTPHAAL